jgi:hypothetical protein
MIPLKISKFFKKNKPSTKQEILDDVKKRFIRLSKITQDFSEETEKISKLLYGDGWKLFAASNVNDIKSRLNADINRAIIELHTLNELIT